MVLGKCPQCGEEITSEDLESDQQRLSLALGSLIATASVVGMLMELPEYQDARSGFEARLSDLIEEAHRNIDHLAEWGGAYDD